MKSLSHYARLIWAMLLVALVLPVVPLFSGVLTQLMGAAGLSMGKKSKGRMSPAYIKYLRYSDFMSADKAVTASSWQELGAWTVPAQQLAQVGFGSQASPEGRPAYIYLKIVDDTAADEDGKIRLIVSDANRMRREVVFECLTTELDGDVNDINKKIPLPVRGPVVGEDSLIILEFYPDGADTIDYDACVFNIPITISNVLPA